MLDNSGNPPCPLVVPRVTKRDRQQGIRTDRTDWSWWPHAPRSWCIWRWWRQQWSHQDWQTSPPLVLPVETLRPLTRYAKLHAPGMSGTFSPAPRVTDPDMHHGTCVTHVPWCMPGSLTSGFLWSQWREKRSRHSRRMRNPQFCVSGKRSLKPNARFVPQKCARFLRLCFC